ncbi:CBS domain-containing protein [soil metagenome]
MGNVSHILKAKDSVIFSISPDISVYNALEIMVAKNVSALPVTDGDKLIGIFTERDYARKVILQGKASKNTLISDIMTVDLLTVTPSTSINDCMQMMTNKFIRHLPVVEEEKLVGIVSIGDLVKFIIEEQSFIIQNMENYITSS